MTYGIFLGYRMVPGAKFTGQYIVADLSDFVGKSLEVDAYSGDWHLSPHHTEQVFLPKRGICFPLRRKYEKVNI